VDSGNGWISTFFFGPELTSTGMWPESNRKQKGVHRYAGASHRKSKNPTKRLQRDLRWTFLLIISKIVSQALPQGMTIQLFFARWGISTSFWSQYTYSPAVQNENTHGLKVWFHVPPRTKSNSKQWTARMMHLEPPTAPKLALSPTRSESFRVYTSVT
jgi:hypothetical protein